MIVTLLMAAQFAFTEPAKAATYFSPAALGTPVISCAHRAARAAISSFEAGWYSAVWIRAREPSLMDATSASSLPTWRFTSIPTWTAPLIFRISEESDGRMRMIAKRLSGQGGYDPGVLKYQSNRLLTPDEQSRFQRALASVVDVLKEPDDCVTIMDGNELILERTDKGQYLVGQRFWQVGQPMAAMDALLARFAGWPP